MTGTADSPRPGPRLARGALYLLVFASLVVMLFPIGWMISTSFKPGDEIFIPPPRWIPRTPTLDGYRVAFSHAVLVPLLNSLVVAAGSALLATGAGALCAYGVSRMRFRGRGALMAVMLATLGLPIPLLMLTLYVMFSRAGILDTYLGLILGHTAITLPVVVWMLKDFFDVLPQEVEEAAYIDGAGLLYTFWRIVLPMAAPGLAAAAIFVFVTSWNEFVFGLTFTSSSTMRPLPAAISLLFLGEFQYRWGDAMAVAVLVTLPVMALFVFFQRFFIQGITAGAVKS
ncbi:MAG: carbohydrate ABC transporter permease [Alphaproteobacteria bacterium]|nr:carbohydrate ABC transporter permease [Alphaproteobacteria bacterium]